CLRAKENMEEGYDEVVVVDGMFLAMKEKTWKLFKFNKALLGFHLYDMDISYRIQKSGLKIVVPKNMVLQHFSRGSFDLNWARTSMSWHKGKELPIYTSSVTDKEAMELEKESRAQFLAYLVKEGFESSSWWRRWMCICIKNRKIHLGILRQM